MSFSGRATSPVEKGCSMSDLIFERDIAIPLRDGAIVHANLYRPADGGRAPVIMTMGPYGKDLHFGAFSSKAYERIDEHGPYLNWETPNPEWWVQQGFTVLRIDQRGSGTSPGQLAVFSHRQALDFYDAIEWAAVQPWSTGKIGLLGVSYYATTQWQVAALQPPHLSAIIPWEGFVDLYRDAARHGGILNTFLSAWYPRQVLTVQYGGDGRLSAQERAAMRVDPFPLMREHVLDDAYYQAYTPDLSQIHVPLLSVGNWGGMGLHLRGNIEGYVGAASQHKWLRMHVATIIPLFIVGKAEQSKNAFLTIGSKAWRMVSFPILLFGSLFAKDPGISGAMNNNGRLHVRFGPRCIFMQIRGALSVSLHLLIHQEATRHQTEG